MRAPRIRDPDARLGGKGAHLKPKPWTLPQLLSANRNAAAVYLALLAMAGGRKRTRATRRRLADQTGMSRDTVSAAVHALAGGQWIALRVCGKGGYRWYDVTLKLDGPPALGKASKRQSTCTGRTGVRDPVTGRFSCTGGTGLSGATKTASNRCKSERHLHRSDRSNPVGDAAGVTAAPPVPGYATPAEDKGAMVSVADLAAEVFGGQQ